jgi:hypothetical protein
MNTKKNVLVGCCGSVAAIKLPVVLNLLKKRDPTLQVTRNFFSYGRLDLSLSLSPTYTHTHKLSLSFLTLSLFLILSLTHSLIHTGWSNSELKLKKSNKK